MIIKTNKQAFVRIAWTTKLIVAFFILFQPFFTGKLILHDPPGLNSVASGAGGKRRPSQASGSGDLLDPSSATTSMTTTLFATQAACMMPSPAEQVTDDLISPKYDTNDETTEDEEDSDDTVYECPGLAAPGEMVVSNPFFLQGGDMPHLEGNSDPKPISQGSIFHHGIKGVN